MLKVNSLKESWRPNITFLATALLVLAADQLSKLWIRSNLALGESIPESGFFRLSHVQNTGAAFGLFQDQTPLLILVSLAGIALILYALSISSRIPFLANKKSRLALFLILGGTVANLIDRLTLGHVTDFIDIGPWPPFNIADSAVVIGVILFAYSALVRGRKG